MDNDAARAILAKIREKKASELGDAALMTLGGGLAGGLAGAPIGAVAGAGYGAARGRPAAGAGRGLLRGAGIGGGALTGSLLADSAFPAGGSPIPAILGALGGGYLGHRATSNLIGEDLEEKPKKPKQANDSGPPLRPGETGLGVPPQIPKSVNPYIPLMLPEPGKPYPRQPLRMVDDFADHRRHGPSVPSLTSAGPSKLSGLLAALKKLRAPGLGNMARGAGTLGAGVLGGVLGGAGYAAAKPVQAKTAADPTGDAFAGALQNAHASALKQDAMGDVGRIGVTALAAGAGARGLIGLIRMLRENTAPPKKTRSGPTLLPLPYPAEPKMASYLSDVLSGNLAGDKTGIPAYMPAATLAGVAGLGLGWKGLDSVLASRRKAEQDEEMEKARSEFHDALIGQYKKPISTHPGLMSKKSEDAIGENLDAAFDVFQETFSKQSLDLSNLAGQAAGGYGVYAGLSGLLAGSLVYDKIQKRSRGAVLQKALQRRQRRQFAQSPTEIYATPEPMEMPAPEIEKDEVPALRG